MKPFDECWKYVVNCYQQPGVESILLELQETDELDIVLCLFVFWLLSNQIAISKESKQGLLHHQSYFLEVISSQRQWRFQNRSLMKGDDRYDEHYKELKGIELSMEKLYLKLLHTNVMHQQPCEIKDCLDRQQLLNLLKISQVSIDELDKKLSGVVV